jgi:hypothetical protein
MPGHRQHNQENRHQDRNGTRRPQHPEQAETPKVPGVGAQTPDGFESLLGMAADRAREHGGPLVLVVDGMDEAEPSSDVLPFGLPGLLPAGVYVIGTYRTGSAPRRPDAPSVTVTIRKDDPRNRRDIDQFLTHATAEQILAARLAEADVDPAEFIGTLADRCDGVWVYLVYVLEELRIGLRRPDALGDLPSGLRDYYADQLRRWRQDSVWDHGLLPLISTLGVAGEPLTAVSLARIAGGLDPAAVRRWCDFTFRPLLTATRTSSAGLPLRYEIYHASFRDVLKAHHVSLSGQDGTQPYDTVALTDELREASVIAHGRAADIYLDAFGGIDRALCMLAKDPAAADIDDGYPLRHLARHLHHSGRILDLHGLLAAETSGRDARRVNVWFAGHDYAECIASYLDDLTRARNVSATATDLAIGNRRPAAALGMEVRYALMTASIASHAANVSADLLERVPIFRGRDLAVACC